MFVFIQISIVCPGFFSLSCFTLGKLLKKVLPWKLVHSLEPSLYLYIYRHFRKLCLMNNFEYAEKYFLLWFDVIIYIFCFNAKEALIHNMTVVNFCANFPKFDVFVIESAVTMAKRRFFYVDSLYYFQVFSPSIVYTSVFPSFSPIIYEVDVRTCDGLANSFFFYSYLCLGMVFVNRWIFCQRL